MYQSIAPSEIEGGQEESDGCQKTAVLDAISKLARALSRQRGQPVYSCTPLDTVTGLSRTPHAQDINVVSCIQQSLHLESRPRIIGIGPMAHQTHAWFHRAMTCILLRRMTSRI